MYIQSCYNLSFKFNFGRFSSGKAEGEGFVARITGKIIKLNLFRYFKTRNAPDTDRISVLDGNQIYGLSRKRA